jgi:hypothetical protein
VYDGDIVCLTNNKQVVDGAYGGLPIHYNTKKAPKVKIIEENLWESDINGFNSKVGFVTNCATTSFSLLADFKEDSLQYKKIIERLKCFRKEQGATIDATKGLIIKPFPIRWTRWKKIIDSMDDETKTSANFENSIVINKRPLFMRYVYSSYNREYIEYNKSCDADCKMRFNKTIKELLGQKELIPEEQKTVNDYYRYSPFIHSDCLMNKLCAYMEESIKEIKEAQHNISSDEILMIIKDHEVDTDKDKLKKLYEVYKRYKSQKRNFANIKLDESGSDDCLKFKTIEQYNKYIRQECLKVSNNVSELANLAIDICYTLYPSDNKNFVWNIFGEEIVNNVMKNRQEKIYVPFKDDSGDIKFLGSYYSLVEINPTDTLCDEDQYDY